MNDQSANLRPPALPASAAAQSAVKPRRVLVVEDNLDTVHTFALLLHEMGHKVEYAINGWVAIDVARRFRPQFVFLDLGLPGMDGFELCRRIKKEPGLESTRVIALTGYGQQEYRDRSSEAGCELHLLKPFDAKNIEELLAS
jgi:CheY-like chemotaxis protein